MYTWYRATPSIPFSPRLPAPLTGQQQRGRPRRAGRARVGFHDPAPGGPDERSRRRQRQHLDHAFRQRDADRDGQWSYFDRARERFHLRPGTLIQITGTNLADSSAAVPSNALALPVNLAGVQVYVDGIQIALQSVVAATPPRRRPSWRSFLGAGRHNSSSLYVRTVHADGSITVTDAIGLPISTTTPESTRNPVPIRASPSPITTPASPPARLRSPEA